MDEFVSRDPPPLTSSWKPPVSVGSREISGSFSPSLKRHYLHTMLKSYTEIGKFNQTELHCLCESNNEDTQMPSFHSHISQMWVSSMPLLLQPYVSCLEFDSKGIYLASANSDGWLTIYDFESLYCSASDKSSAKVAPVVGISSGHKLEAVRWNPSNQEEVACVASGKNLVYCYDLGFSSCKPHKVFKVKPSFNQSFGYKGFYDVMYCKTNANRVLACGHDGNIHLWDRRCSDISQSALVGPEGGIRLNSLQLSMDEQIIYAGGERGHIHAWDLRGGRTSAAFLIPGEVYHPPFTSVKLATLLQQVPALIAQTQVEVSGIQSIIQNPCHGDQLAFHLNNGWSGVLNLCGMELTHLHCPPPPWVDGEPEYRSIRRRKPAWLSTHHIFAGVSTSSRKISLLDFRPGGNSACSVEERRKHKESLNLEVQVSAPAISCAAHPMTDNLMAGTEGGSLVLIGMKKERLSCIEIETAERTVL